MKGKGKKICFFSLYNNSTNGAPRKSNRPYPPRDIHYEKGVVMEPFLIKGGDVGRDVRVWRDLSGGASGDEAKLDEYLKTSLAFLKNQFEAAQ